ncbi:EFR1 family ferrodoxin [Anaerocolumna sp.]|uniref:EFR1 family ferrodoxin n=1 Tax=Anaerocolumna sp. TaxID=2041569 RepID=UPI0028AEDA5B|nr:EFR1 family ferrodoxin [Anaerocolumna sp.]
MGKNLKLLYFSATDTTAKIVKEIAYGIGAPAKEYDITLPADRQKELSFHREDVVIIGVPVYAGRVPGFLTEYFTKVKGNQTKAVFIVVYGNRDYEDALLELKDTLEQNGFIGIAGGAFIGEHSYTTKLAAGRPDKEDLNSAREFGVKIKEILNKDNQDTIKKLIIKGNYPYKERKPQQPVAPETNDKCINCGICAMHCPMGAIDLSDFEVVDETKCIKCCRCIKRCPVNAKAIKQEAFIQFTQGLIDKFGATRREPELFL